jgi:hypothetical protein
MSRATVAPLSLAISFAITSGCGAAAATTTGGALRDCSASSGSFAAGAQGTNDGRDPSGRGLRESTFAGVQFIKRGGPPCRLGNVHFLIESGRRYLNVPDRPADGRSGAPILRRRGDVSVTTVSWFASWCGRVRGPFDLVVRWSDGRYTSTGVHIASPPCQTRSGTDGFLTQAAWLMNPGHSTRA